MGSNIYVAGVGMSRFTAHTDKTYQALASIALDEVFKNADMDRKEIQAAFFSNSLWGHFEGQHCIRGQCALRPQGMLGIPILNLENACGSGSSALFAAYLAIKSGEFDVALCLGVEKMTHPDKALSFEGLMGGIDRTNVNDTFKLYEKLTEEYGISPGPDDGLGKSKAMDVYALMARWHMSRYGSVQEDFAKVAVKNRFNGSLNPNAHWQKAVSLEEVLGDRLISYPLTRSMCAPIGDGAAACILVSEKYLPKLKGPKPIKVRALANASGHAKKSFDESQPVSERTVNIAYEKAGLGPEDVNIAEIHDASAPGEIIQTESLGFTPKGTGAEFLASGKSALDGKLAVNTSGGLISRGHPLGASGIAQIHELVTQMRGMAGKRQLPKTPRIGLAENGGGIVTIEEASVTITILENQ